ncbi:MAG: hypothetical protein XD41_0824 [Desulfonauticus sp. 38_4375]|nr:MAG: hypothetical protein XD41_0824 [Desulfonauticus sp. 38_4375]
MENIILAVIIGLSVFFLGKRFWQIFKGQKGCGCAGCKCGKS